MSRRMMVVAVALVAMAASVANAAEVKPMDQGAIERSWAIQAELAGIEQDKEAFVDALLASWVPYVDGNAYDAVSELKPIAMAAYPWRLYGASLVGDYRTMVRLLRGEAAPGRYIQALDKPEPKVRFDSKALGATASSLVFTPIPPCRAVDTRGTGARTGILNPGSPRTFDLTVEGLGEGQGGDLTCTGLPTFSHAGWAANITVTGYSANGGLLAFGFTGAPPSSSIINFFTSGYAIANASALTGCYGCIDDVTISTFGSPTHVVIDVTGYYEQAVGYASGVVTEMAGTTTTIPANTTMFINGAACPSGTVLVAGGHSNGSSGVNAVITSDHRRSSTLWTEFLRNPNAGASTTATVSSYSRDLN